MARRITEVGKLLHHTSLHLGFLKPTKLHSETIEPIEPQEILSWGSDHLWKVIQDGIRRQSVGCPVRDAHPGNLNAPGLAGGFANGAKVSTGQRHDFGK